MPKQFYCPLHGSHEGVRVSSLQLTEDRILRVGLECMTCEDHLGTTVSIPLETFTDYDLPEIGSNIYNPLMIELRKKGNEPT